MCCLESTQTRTHLQTTTEGNTSSTPYWCCTSPCIEEYVATTNVSDMYTGNLLMWTLDT